MPCSRPGFACLRRASRCGTYGPRRICRDCVSGNCYDKHMDRPEKSLADYVAIAISPALIMALVCSLVFFLLEVLYQGRYQGSLQHILFFFVFGAVLVARISMQGGISERAGLYGLVLGLVPG